MIKEHKIVPETRILWIEDDAIMLDAFTVDIKRKYKLDIAFSFDEALSYLSTQPYDVILLDLLIPRSYKDLSEYETEDSSETLNGLVLLKVIRQELNIHCPVIVISVVYNSDTEMNLKALNAISLHKGLLTSRELINIIEDSITR